MDGWQFTDGTKKQVRICGPICDTVRTDLKANVIVSLSCEKQRIR
jgi:hypothetical protein